MSINLTEAASKELKTLLEKEAESNNISAEAGLRVMVAGGGCSGFSYRIGFDDNVTDQDKTFDSGGIKVVVDQRSLLYLNGTEIDFHDGLQGRGFVFNNPNNTGSCGGSCGSACS